MISSGISNTTNTIAAICILAAIVGARPAWRFTKGLWAMIAHRPGKTTNDQ